MQRVTRLKKVMLISVLWTLMAGSFASATEKPSMTELVRASEIIFEGYVLDVFDVDKPHPKRIVMILMRDVIKGNPNLRYKIRELHLSSEHQSVKDEEGDLLFQKLKADNTQNIFFLRYVPDPTFDSFREYEKSTPFYLELLGVDRYDRTLVKQIEQILTQEGCEGK